MIAILDLSQNFLLIETNDALRMEGCATETVLEIIKEGWLPDKNPSCGEQLSNPS